MVLGGPVRTGGRAVEAGGGDGGRAELRLSGWSTSSI